MSSTKTVLGALLLSFSLSAPAAAQDAAALDAPTPATAPEAVAEPEVREEHPHREVRLDFEVPSLGIGTWGSNAGIAGNFGVLVAHRSGHGAAVHYRNVVQFFGANLSTWDAGYTYRFHAAGDDWLGLGVTLGAGLSYGTGEDVQGFWSSVNGPMPDGDYAGGYTEASLDFRAYGFLVGIGGSYHALVPVSMPGDLQHAVEAHLTLGFGFVM